MRAYPTHTCTQSQRLKANRATPHQAINTVRKIHLNNPFTSPADASPDRPWHHVSMLLESEHPSNHARRQGQHLPRCAVCSWQPTISKFLLQLWCGCSTTLLTAFGSLKWFSIPLLHMQDTIRHSTACVQKREGGGVLHASYRRATVLWQRTKKDPCTIHKVGCNEKKKKRGPPPATFQVRVGRLFWWHREFVLQVISFSFLKCSQPQLF